jgi:hypothetical protein
VGSGDEGALEGRALGSAWMTSALEVEVGLEAEVAGVGSGRGPGRRPHPAACGSSASTATATMRADGCRAVAGFPMPPSVAAAAPA